MEAFASTLWILKNNVMPHMGLPDLHALASVNSATRCSTRLERNRKEGMQLVPFVVALHYGRFTIYARNYNAWKMSEAMAGIRFAP